MLTIRAMSDGKGYSARHLEHNDYYADGERVVGEWFGRGAGLLGLNGAVKTEDFEAVRQGLDPNSKEFLRLRKSADRVAADGTKLSQGRSLYDFTISAPKSVSVVALLGEDHRLIDAHQTAVREALQELEACAAARVRQGGANADRATGNLVVAVYHHDTSRELDPQLHAHAVTANLTFDGVEGRWKALQASDIYERRAYLTEVYRNVLAREVRALGYEIDNRRDSKGRDSGFEIRGASENLLEKFSQRSQQRDRAIGEFAAKNGRQPTDNEVAVLVRKSRADKLIAISTGEVHERQRARLSPDDQRILAIVRSEHRLMVVEASESSLAHAKQHIFERVSVARDHEVLTEALRYGRGRIRIQGLKGELALQESSGRVLRNGREIATEESLERERSMIAAVNRGIGSFEALACDRAFQVSDLLRPEQKCAIEGVLKSRDRAVSISGAAGTGKTAALRELGSALLESGREVVAVAPSMSAVEELQKVGFENAVTLERLLQDPRMRQGLKRSVVILDEAGMVSARQMYDFLRLAEENSIRIIFSGDTKQIQSVEAGDALRILEKESKLKTFALTQVQRQTSKDYRDAIQELRRHPERGFAKLDAIGAVREVAPAYRAQEVARAYAEQRNRTSMVVCATHDEIDRVTEAIRAHRKTAGELGQSITLKRHISLGWTLAQKSDYRTFQRGQILVFHRAVKGIAKCESAEVVRVGSDGVVVRTAAGMELTLTGKQAKSFDVMEQKLIDVAPGDRLLLTANRNEEGLRTTNGELVTVTAVEAAGRLNLEDGRILPGDYRSFAYGYAVTAHRSQGKTVDSVVISADGMRKELFYVAASRGRESITVVTSDKDHLTRTVARTAARKSASELVCGTPCRGLSMARKLISTAVIFINTVHERLAEKMDLLGRRKEHRHEHAIGR